MLTNTPKTKEGNMKNTTSVFAPGDRYVYDFRLCTTDKGWAQVDTSQDASYFGTWINPSSRKILCSCEGDVTVTSTDTDAELAEEIAEMKQWNVENGHRFLGIDPGFNENLKQALITAGLAEYLH
jgi:hypothetical protein